MNLAHRGSHDSPAPTRGVESLGSLEAKLNEAISRVMPGEAPELLGDASRSLRRTARLFEARRRHEREPMEVFWTNFLHRARERKDDTERRLLNAGVVEEANRLAA